MGILCCAAILPITEGSDAEDELDISQIRTEEREEETNPANHLGSKISNTTDMNKMAILLVNLKRLIVPIKLNYFIIISGIREN
jgi:hypothetical protein